MDWLLVLGLLLCRAGFAWQLVRGWRQHGLTYVAWPTLLALSAGSAALAFWGLIHAEPAVVVLSMVPGTVDVLAAGLKARDGICTRLRIPVGGHHRPRRR